MKVLGLMMSLLVALVLSACGSGGSDDDGPGGSGEDEGGYAQPEGPAPDLATLEGGTSPLKPTNGSDYPDSCSVLTEEMVLALVPAAGEGGSGGVIRSSEDQNGTDYMCQYASATSEGDNKGFIIISFDQNAGAVDRSVIEEVFNSSKEGSGDVADFVDYGADLGAGSSAYFNGHRLEVLGATTMFSVAASGTEPSQDDQTLWRDNVAVPVAKNILSRLR